MTEEIRPKNMTILRSIELGQAIVEVIELLAVKYSVSSQEARFVYDCLSKGLEKSIDDLINTPMKSIKIEDPDEVQELDEGVLP